MGSASRAARERTRPSLGGALRCDWSTLEHQPTRTKARPQPRRRLSDFRQARNCAWPMRSNRPCALESLCGSSVRGNGVGHRRAILRNFRRAGASDDQSSLLGTPPVGHEFLGLASCRWISRRTGQTRGAARAQLKGYRSGIRAGFFLNWLKMIEGRRELQSEIHLLTDLPESQ